MVFEESNYIDLTNIPTTFIYFLIRNNEVVYVGQTIKGLARVYAHKDKKYDRVYVIKCDKEKLDYTENFYITKYNPLYNQQFNLKHLVSVQKVAKKLRLYIKNTYTDKGFICPIRLQVQRAKKMINNLGIQYTIFNENFYITKNDYELIVDNIDNYVKGVSTNEVFNLGIQPRISNAI